MNSTDEVYNWIRKNAYDVGYTKDNKFIGLTLFTRNFVRSFEAMLARMIDEGLLEDMVEFSKNCAKDGGGKVEEKDDEVIILTPKSISKPKGEISGIAAESSKKEDTSTAKHFNFSRANIDIPIIETETPVHTFRFQHKVLTAAQSALENVCYNFSEKHYPSIISRNKWKYPEAGEITAWAEELIDSYEADPKPVNESIHNPTRFPQVLRKLTHLRDTTVHRTQVSGTILSSLLGDAFSAAKMFKDDRGVNAIALLFHGQSDCLRLAQEAKKEKVNIQLYPIGCIESLEGELKELEGKANRMWEKTLTKLECASQNTQEIDMAYENVLEYQLDWMCAGAGSRKSYNVISREFQIQLPDKPDPGGLQDDSSSSEDDEQVADEHHQEPASSDGAFADIPPVEYESDSW